jgi:hypothetical protein
MGEVRDRLQDFVDYAGLLRGDEKAKPKSFVIDSLGHSATRDTKRLVLS